MRVPPGHTAARDKFSPLTVVFFLCMRPSIRTQVQVASKPSGEKINALEQHIRNLLTPSTPTFFNTLYDPFQDGTDFVRGYPFSWREGVPTAVRSVELARWRLNESSQLFNTLHSFLSHRFPMASGSTSQTTTPPPSSSSLASETPSTSTWS